MGVRFYRNLKKACNNAVLEFSRKLLERLKLVLEYMPDDELMEILEERDLMDEMIIR